MQSTIVFATITILPVAQPSVTHSVTQGSRLTLLQHTIHDLWIRFAADNGLCFAIQTYAEDATRHWFRGDGGIT
jgi:hypothetical protein